MERINILWTGGFDSTFRVCQLSLLNIEIQPFYIREKRKSEPNELKAITDITDYIRSNKVSKCNLLPLYIINHTDMTNTEVYGYVTVQTSQSANETKIDTAITQATLARKHLTNRDKIDEDTNTLIRYDDDGTTPLVTFDLEDQDGTAASTNIFEKVPQ